MKKAAWTTKNDPRVTGIGKIMRKTSIDELPQFWNVLKGDMSLVGTRPPTVDEFKQYEARHKRRLSMKPGLTGLWQVSDEATLKTLRRLFVWIVNILITGAFSLIFKLSLKTVS